MMLAIAWRNLWRHPRRTIVILLAVVVGVWAMVFYAAFLRGMMEEMVRQNIANLIGHVQVQAAGYAENPVIENRIRNAPAALASVQQVLPAGARVASRLRAGVVVRSARGAFGATLVGIGSGEENGVSFVGEIPIEGRSLDADANGVLVGRALLERLEARIGHRIVVDAQGGDGAVLSRAFTIVGVFRAQLEATERHYVFCRRETLQEALGVGSDVSEIAIVLPRDDEVRQVADAVQATLPAGDLRVLTWRDMVPFAGAWIESMGMFTIIWNVVVFVAMSFGLVNTVLMAVFERIREFGLIRALGVTPFGIVRSVLLETGMLLGVGCLAGAAIAYATLAWLAREGIDLSAFAAGSEFLGMARVIYPRMLPGDFTNAAATVLVLGMLVSLYPAVKAARITPVRAMAHV